MMVLKNCRLIPEITEGFQVDGLADIMIEGENIVDIVSSGNQDYDCEIVDAAGKTVLPGLIELHGHLDFFNDDLSLEIINRSDILFHAYQYAMDYLKGGYTTVRECGNVSDSAALKRAINEGILVGPNLITAGMALTPTEIGNQLSYRFYKEVDTPGEIRKGVRQELQKGNDFIKYMVTGAYMNEGGEPGELLVTLEELKAAVEAASLKGTYVAGHCHGAEGVKLAIKAGLRTIEHATFIDDEGIEMLLNSSETYAVPTAGIGYAAMKDSEDMGYETELVEKSKKYLSIETESMTKLYQSGVKLGWGSDMTREQFLKHPGCEFIARKEMFGYENMHMLMQATKFSAEIARIEDKVGTIKIGKLADLIVVDGNPDQDIYVMTKPMVEVIKSGKRVSLNV